jgi:hypothetical protein
VIAARRIAPARLTAALAAATVVALALVRVSSAR